MSGHSQVPHSFDDVTRDLGLAIEDPLWRESWEESQSAFVAHHREFLSREYIERTCQWVGFCDELRAALLDSHAMIERNESLRRLSWHCHYLLFRAEREPYASRQTWIRMPREILASPSAPLFHALVLLSGVPHMRRLHAGRDIDEAITRDTLSDIEVWLLHHRAIKGAWGFTNHSWLYRHFTGNIFKLGRLQFALDHFPFEFQAFRRRTDKRVVLFAPAGKRFRSDGQFDGTTGVTDAQGGWTSSFEANGERITGNPIKPTGEALHRTLDLPGAEWENILKPNDPVLDVHIPATGPMTHLECGESFRRALRFFPRHFPEHQFRAFTCHSWLMDNQLGDFLPADSNIVRFLREFYLHPYEGANDNQTFERTFGRKFDNIDDAPQDTTLRRAIVRLVKQGGHWRIGSGLVFPDDLAWGEQVYRKRWREDV